MKFRKEAYIDGVLGIRTRAAVGYDLSLIHFKTFELIGIWKDNF